MSNINDLHKLIINNLAIIAKANELIPEIKLVLEDKINEIETNWAEEQNWLLRKDKHDENQYYLKQWVKESKVCVYFERCFFRDISNNYNDDFSQYFNVVDSVNDFVTFCFTFEYAANGYNKKQWINFLQTEFKKYENTPEFEHIEIYDDIYLIVKFKIDPQVLVDNYPDTIEDALTPVVDALAVIKNATQKIDEIYQAALANRA